jgi:hypothetical protein
VLTLFELAPLAPVPDAGRPPSTVALAVESSFYCDLVHLSELCTKIDNLKKVHGCLEEKDK